MKITADRYAYNRGDLVTYSSTQVVHRSCCRRRAYGWHINHPWTVESVSEQARLHTVTPRPVGRGVSAC